MVYLSVNIKRFTFNNNTFPPPNPIVTTNYSMDEYNFIFKGRKICSHLYIFKSTSNLRKIIIDSGVLWIVAPPPTQYATVDYKDTSVQIQTRRLFWGTTSCNVNAVLSKKKKIFSQYTQTCYACLFTPIIEACAYIIVVNCFAVFTWFFPPICPQRRNFIVLNIL